MHRLGRAVAMTLLVAWSLPGSGVATAHDGLGLRPIFTSPTGLTVVTDAVGTAGEIPIRWTSVETHEDTSYRLYHQAPDVPPTPSVAQRERVGTQFATFVADANSYDAPWDISALATGVYRVYVEFDEPPFCDEIELAPAVVVVRRPGEPPPLAAVVTAPQEDSVTADETASISLEAIGAGPLTATIEAGDLIRDPDFPPDTLCVEFIWGKTRDVATDVALVADPDAGPDRYRLDMAWDTTDVPVGAYLLRVTLSDSAGETRVVYARRWVNVDRGGTGPIGPLPVTDTRGGDDVGDTTDTQQAESQPSRGDEGCAAGPSRGWTAWILLFAALWVLWGRRASALIR